MSFASTAAGLAGALALLGARDLVGPALRRAGRRRRGRSALGRVFSAIAARFGSVAIMRRLNPPGDLRTRLAAAGNPGGVRPREWMALMGGAALVAAAPSITVLAGGTGGLGLLVAAAGPVAGFLAPDFWLTRAVQARGEASVRALPDMLDLLRVSVEAGIAPIRAMGSVAAQFEGPLAIEWRRAAAAVALGEPQDAALAQMAERIDADEVRTLAAALVRSRRHGLPLGATLATHAARAREARRRRIREQAARAGPKMQLVVALVLVPSMLLVVTALLVSELGPALTLGV